MPNVPGKPVHYQPGLNKLGRWMHVTHGDGFTLDPARVTCARCLPRVSSRPEGGRS